MNKLKQHLPDLLAILLFVVISFAYFFPAVTEGRILTGHDHMASIGLGHEAQQHYERTGERTRWTNVIFGGMPTYQMGPSYNSTDKLKLLEQAYHLYLPTYVWYLFVLMLGFFILLRVFNFRTWMAALGAIVWAFSSYFFIIIGAGHIWKMMALAYIPPTIAGMVMLYRGKYLWGGIVTALFTALQIYSNHVQMSYYFLIVMGTLFVVFACESFHQRKMSSFAKATAILIVAGVVGISINLSNLYHTYEYSKETIRGKTELATVDQHSTNETKGGLQRDYITQWSYGVGETWSLLVPNVKGGASVPLANNTEAMKKAKPEYRPVFQQIGQYWGEQPGTSGPVYVGAFVLTLFVLGLFLVKGALKWGLVIATLLSILLSWGKNFIGFTNFFLDYVPMYDKFRAVSSILVVAEFTIPLLGLLGLKEWIERPDLMKERMKYLYISAALTGGMAFLFALMPDLFFGQYISSTEQSMLQNAVQAGQLPHDFILNLAEVRKSIFTADAWRSFWVVAVGVALLLLFAFRKLKKSEMLIATLIILCLIDMWGVNRRYLNNDMFVHKSNLFQGVKKTATDETILADKTLGYRVLNFASNTFNENNTAYYHRSVGGYHAAKLSRYQELIERYISPEMSTVNSAIVAAQGDLTKINTDTLSPVINMLNTRYYIFPIQGGTAPIYNPGANGAAWFVSQIKYVNNANEEISSLGQINTKEIAVVNQDFVRQLQNAAMQQPKDSLSLVELVQYTPNALTYQVESTQGGVVLFSEVYYPGWQAYINGQPVEHARANYLLRAMYVPAGQHTIEFKFDPQSLHTTEAIAHVALSLLLLAVIAGAALLFYRKREKKLLP